MNFRFAVLAFLVLPLAASAKCYELWDRDGNSIYRAQSPPWPMSWPETDTRLRDASRSRGEQLIIHRDEACPREHVVTQKPPVFQPPLRTQPMEAPQFALPTRGKAYRCEELEGITFSQVPCAPTAIPLHTASQFSANPRTDEAADTLHGIRLGMSPKEVTNVLGRRGSERTARDTDGSRIYWSYLAKGRITESRRTETTRPALELVFNNDRLTSIRETSDTKMKAWATRSVHDEERLEVGMDIREVERRIGSPATKRQELRSGSHWQYWSYGFIHGAKIHGIPRATNRPIDLTFRDGILITIERPRGTP